MVDIRRRSPLPSIKVSTLQFNISGPETEPRNILEKIVWQKEIEVAALREKLPLLDLQKQLANLKAPRDFLGALKAQKTSPAVIAEVKKASPSKGVFREDFDPVRSPRATKQTALPVCLS